MAPRRYTTATQCRPCCWLLSLRHAVLLQVEGKRYITVRRKKKKQRQQDAAQGPKSPPLIMGPDAHTAIEQHMQSNPERGLDRKPVQDIAAKDKCTAYTKCTCISFFSSVSLTPYCHHLSSTALNPVRTCVWRYPTHAQLSTAWMAASAARDEKPQYARMLAGRQQLPAWACAEQVTDAVFKHQVRARRAHASCHGRGGLALTLPCPCHTPRSSLCQA